MSIKRVALLSVLLAAAASAGQDKARVDYATKAAGAKVTCSSELGEFKGKKYFASSVIDGATVGDYWTSDMQKGAKPPHWLEVDLGRDREVGEVALFMVPRRGQTLSKFRIEAEVGGQWTLVGQALKAQDDPAEGGLAARYGEDAATYGVFRAVLAQPVTTRKVKLTIDAPATARLLEIQVFGPRPPAKIVERKPVDPSKMMRFDLGAAGSPVEAGWTGLGAKDEYNDALGYGWAGVKGLAGADRETGYAVTRDLVAGLAQGKEPARHTFRVKATKGAYAVAVVSGDLDFAVPPFSIAAEGKVVAPRVGTGDRGGWDAQTFTVDVQDGVLDLTFEAEGAWAANAIIVAPAGQFAAVLDEVEKLDGQYAWRDQGLTEKIKERKPDEPAGDLKVTAERKQRGFEVWRLPRVARVYPTTVPDEKSVTRELSLRATPAEYASLTLALRTFRPLRDVKVTASDLSGPAGRLPASIVSAAWVRFWPQHEEKWAKRGDEFMVVPEMIHPMGRGGELWLSGDTTRQFWVTVRVPADAKPGRYAGKLTVSADGAPGVEVALNLETLPFELRWPKPMAWGIYYYPQRMPNMANFKADLLDMKSNGLNMFCFESGAKLTMTEKGPQWDLSELKSIMATVKEVGGYEGPYPLVIGSALPPGPLEEPKFKVMREFMKFLESERAKEGWPEFLYYLVDEPFHDDRIEEAAKYYEAAKKVAGIRTYCTVGWKAVERVGQWIDVRTHSPTVAQGFEWPKVRESALANKGEFWWYTNATRCYFDVMRMKAGFFHWRIRATGQTYWHYCNNVMTPFCDFDGGGRDHCSVYPGLDGPIRTLQWEAHRDGVNDAKYAYTLEAAIADARKAGAPAAAIAKAQAVLDSLAARVNVDMASFDEKHPDRRYAFHYYCDWPPEQFDQERETLVNAILELKAAK